MDVAGRQLVSYNLVSGPLAAQTTESNQVNFQTNNSQYLAQSQSNQEWAGRKPPAGLRSVCIREITRPDDLPQLGRANVSWWVQVSQSSHSITLCDTTETLQYLLKKNTIRQGMI